MTVDTDLPEKGDLLVEERLHVHEQDGDQCALGQLGASHLTVQTVPVTLCVVATIVTVTIGVMLLTVSIIDGTERRIYCILQTLSHL